MGKYNVKITETLVRSVETEADSYEEAEDKVRELYDDCSIVLDASDFEDVYFEPDDYGKL